MEYRRRKKQSALIFILKGLIPYSRENMLLAFSPNRFFNELEKISNYQEATLKNAYWRAKDQGLIKETNKSVRLTAEGLKEVRPFVATKLKNNVRLMVIFDIPEQQATKRHRLRDLLKSWEFKQVQKSVWSSDRDHEEDLIEIIAELKLGQHVEIYESARLFPKSKQ